MLIGFIYETQTKRIVTQFQSFFIHLFIKGINARKMYSTVLTANTIKI